MALLQLPSSPFPHSPNLRPAFVLGHFTPTKSPAKTFFCFLLNLIIHTIIYLCLYVYSQSRLFLANAIIAIFMKPITAKRAIKSFLKYLLKIISVCLSQQPKVPLLLFDLFLRQTT